MPTPDMGSRPLWSNSPPPPTHLALRLEIATIGQVKVAHAPVDQRSSLMARRLSLPSVPIRGGSPSPPSAGIQHLTRSASARLPAAAAVPASSSDSDDLARTDSHTNKQPVRLTAWLHGGCVLSSHALWASLHSFLAPLEVQFLQLAQCAPILRDNRALLRFLASQVRHSLSVGTGAAC